jgi:hypothetical protein
MGKSDKPRTIHLRDHEVRSALAGELRQVRRALSPQPELAIMDAQSAAALRGAQDIGLVPSDETPRWRWRGTFMMPWPHCIRHMSPFGPPGTVLIGKEAWAGADRMYQDHDNDCPSVIAYFADKSAYNFELNYKIGRIDLASWNWKTLHKRSPATMPAWAARIRLVNRGVRVERGESGWEWVVDVDVEVQP